MFSCSFIKLHLKRLQGLYDDRLCKHMPSPKKLCSQNHERWRGNYYHLAKVFKWVTQRACGRAQRSLIWFSLKSQSVSATGSALSRPMPFQSDTTLLSTTYGLPETKIIYLIRNTIDQESPEGWTKGSPHSVPSSCLRRAAKDVWSDFYPYIYNLPGHGNLHFVELRSWKLHPLRSVLKHC